MNTLISHFLKNLTLLTLIVAIVGAVAFGFFLRSWYIPVLPFLLLFFFGFTLLTFSFLVKAEEKGFNRFVRARMAITMLRLFVYIIITALYVALIKEGTICFVIVLGLLYLIYTTFEVYHLSQIPPGKQERNK